MQLIVPEEFPLLRQKKKLSSTSTEPGTYTCQACGQTFSSMQELNTHNQQMHGGSKPK